MYVNKRGRRTPLYELDRPTAETPLPLQTSAPSRCLRCEGFMIPDYSLDLDDEFQRRWCWVLRCIQCGDVIDPVILTHRALARDAR